MSSHFYNSSTPLAVKSAIHIAMQDLQGLASYLATHMKDQNLSTHDVAKRSGNVISHSTVHNVLNCVSKEIKISTLVGLARGLGRPEDEVFAVARGKRLDLDGLEGVGGLFSGWEQASAKDKKAVLEAIKIIAEGFQSRLHHRN